MSGDQTLHFSFDVISHNAYLAWTQIHTLAARHDLVVEPEPVLFAGLLAAHGQLGPAEIRPKSMWMLRDVVRKAQRLGIPLAPPAGHPFNPLLALRACCLDHGPDALRRLVDGLFRAAWAESRDVSRPDVVADVATAAGLDGDDIVTRAAAPEAKQRLRDLTDAAIARGVFGVPTMEVRGTLFWGFDDLPNLERFLEGRDPVTDLDLSPWYAIRPLAQRRQVEPTGEE